MEKQSLKNYESARYQQVNKSTQIVTLAFLIIVALMIWLATFQTINANFVYIVLGLVAVFTFFWYYFFPDKAYKYKILVEYLVLVFLVSVLVNFTGGVNSLFNFLYYLVIMGAVARTTFSNTLLIAVTVALAIIIQCAAFLNTPDLSIAFRQAGVLLINETLVTLLAIYLIRENEKNSKKYYEELIEVEKIKEEDRLKDEFVFIASHELRAPITTMKGYLELLIKEYGSKMNGDMIRTLKVVFHDANHLSEMVEDMLNVARIEAGKFKYSPTVFSVSAMAKDLVEGMKPKAKTKKIDLTYEGTADLKITADEGKVEEIIDNLIDNAIKYTPEFGKVVVSAHTHEGNVVVNVKDNGLGIPADFKKHIFEKFSRVERSQPGMTGTGLGLFIVKQLVKRMGGEIWFESDEGKGSTFSFSFPVAH